MTRLDYFQNNVPENSSYTNRKLQLPDHNHINLYGVRGAGKSALVAEYLQEMDEETLLYLDFEDPNLLFSPLTAAEIETYVEQHGIELLVLDHFEASGLEDLPRAERRIVISRTPIEKESFESVALFPLDYEEFLLFERSVSQTSGFNRFLKLGTLPLMSQYPHRGPSDLKAILHGSFDAQERLLLTLLASFQTRHLTTHQIYTAAKERFKVSKDWLYRKIKEFQREGILYFLDDLYQKGGRKMILFDFALAKYLSLSQPFIAQFDAMIALALIKHLRTFKTLGIHGYITDHGELILPAPFESEESLWKKSHGKFSLYKKYGIRKVTIVTVANSYDYTIEKLHFEALPFYEWSILNEEE
jgi:predicted AAA+ superfamily ATPase